MATLSYCCFCLDTLHSLHYIHYITLHSLHYITFITLHYITLHCSLEYSGDFCGGFMATLSCCCFCLVGWETDWLTDWLTNILTYRLGPSKNVDSTVYLPLAYNPVSVHRLRELLKKSNKFQMVSEISGPPPSVNFRPIQNFTHCFQL